MCEPIPKQQNQYRGKTSAQGDAVGLSAGTSSQKNWHDRCCWHFNWGEKCKKWNCRFDHRCSGCGAWDHALVNCPKNHHESPKAHNVRHKGKGHKGKS